MIKDVDGRLIPPGTRVVLVDKRYHDGPSNPRVGTEWECEGTMIGGSAVQWDNGHHNTYSHETLKISDSCVSIW